MIFNRVRNRYLFLVDIALSFLAYIIVILLLWPVREIGVHIQDGYQQILATPIVYALVLLILGIYRIDWVYASGKEYAQLIAACVIAAIVDTVLGQYLTKGAYYLKMNIANHNKEIDSYDWNIDGEDIDLEKILNNHEEICERLKENLKQHFESDRDEMITSMIDHMDDAEYAKIRTEVDGVPYEEG